MDGSWQSGMILDSHADALTNTAMDSDYIDNFLLDGSWLEATDVSEFLNYCPSAATTSQSSNEDANQLSLFLENNPSQNLAASESEGCDDQAGFSGRKNGNQKLQTGPRLQNPSSASSIKDRLTGAVGCIRDLVNDKDALVQIWVPMGEMGSRVLTTHDQPFALDGGSQRLANYRDISVNYQFPAEEETDFSKVTSMPGRVFLAQVPEWSPDVQLFTSDEYPRVDHARKYNVRGTLAVPVFEKESEDCLGVIEILTTRQGIKYQSELEKVSKALEAVDLQSSGTPISQTIKATAADMAYEAALPEIKQVLKTACETHELPLAQTWIPCTIQQHPDENYPHCVLIVEEACIIRNPKARGFHEACSEQHLLKGQGVAGRALATNEPCFSSDITRYSKDEYPLSCHARMFGLHGAVAIRLRSVITGEADFVLEFFLPWDCRTPDEQQKMLNSLSVVVEDACQTLRVVTDQELESEKGMGFWEQKGNEEGWKLGKPVDRKRTKSERKISLEILRQHFSGTLKDAATSLGVCSTTLKRICRQHGITRWPSRKLKKVGHSLKKLQVVMDSVEGTSGSMHINSFYTNFPNLDSNNPPELPSTIITQPEEDALKPKPASPSSCSQSSASSAEPVRSPAGEEQGNVVSKNVLNRVERVKVAYGNEIVRFRISNNWGYRDLLVEIGRRFGIEEMKRFDVKYLDDDSEWVLLTCDEDFEECVEVCHASLNQTVKLLLQASSRGSSD